MLSMCQCWDIAPLSTFNVRTLSIVNNIESLVQVCRIITRDCRLTFLTVVILFQVVTGVELLLAGKFHPFWARMVEASDVIRGR